MSGDTRRSASLEANARGADLLVHEALAPRLVRELERAAAAAGRANLARIAADIPGYHTSPVEAAAVASAAGARHLLLTHVVPPLPLPGLDQVFLEGVGEAFGGGVTLGRDGTRVSHRRLRRRGGLAAMKVLRTPEERFRSLPVARAALAAFGLERSAAS